MAPFLCRVQQHYQILWKMEMWMLWTALVVVFLIVEVCSQILWTLCLAVGCLLALALSMVDVALEWQLISVGVASLLAYVILAPYAKRWHERAAAKNARQARTGMDALLGRRATVTEPIRPGELGRARIDGDNWQVSAPAIPYAVPEGAEVIVTGYDSIILEVTLPKE